ncbi:MAG: hypothetical protein WBL27_00535 [Salinimicrobium sp.]
MSRRNLIILTKIILFYSLFYILMKFIFIFKGYWLLPNLVLMLPFLGLAVISGFQVKNERYSWLFVGIGAALIILTRIFEAELVLWLHNSF